MPEAPPPDALVLAESPENEAAWAAALEAMELHLDEVRAGLEVGFLPSPYSVAAPDSPVPVSLAQRALRLVAAQHDLEEALRERMATLSSVLSGSFQGAPAPMPAYMDERG